MSTHRLTALGIAALVLLVNTVAVGAALGASQATVDGPIATAGNEPVTLGDNRSADRGDRPSGIGPGVELPAADTSGDGGGGVQAHTTAAHRIRTRAPRRQAEAGRWVSSRCWRHLSSSSHTSPAGSGTDVALTVVSDYCSIRPYVVSR
jgi:hypothetical protein